MSAVLSNQIKEFEMLCTSEIVLKNVLTGLHENMRLEMII